MSTQVDKPTAAALPELAADANREHAHCKAAFSDAVEHALAAGRLLLEAKVAVAHGEWLPWIEQNFDGGTRTAQGYMRLARDSANAQRLAHLGIAGALRELSATRDTKGPGAEWDEAIRLCRAGVDGLQRRFADCDLSNAAAVRAFRDEAREWQNLAGEIALRIECQLGRLLRDGDVAT